MSISPRYPGSVVVAYLGVGYTGPDEHFLPDRVEENREWLKADRLPRCFGNGFVVLYDSNTAREFVRKCRQAAQPGELFVYPMDRPFEY
jgi:hypothetical protein